jgi:hypothetical protein
MKPALIENWSNRTRPIIGMVHLRPLPGAPGFDGDLETVIQAALADARALASGGVDGLMIENFGDSPFHPGDNPPITIASMTAIGQSIANAVQLPLGFNVLRNDGRAALASALATGGRFIRVNILCGARVTDQGIIQGIADQLLRDRANLRAGHVRILADVNVKHSAAIGLMSLDQQTHDLVLRGKADAVVVSGTGTGTATDLAELKQVKAAAGGAPVFIGSGLTAENLVDYAAYADGFIVGTAIKRDGDVLAPVDPERLAGLVEARNGCERRR